MPNLPPNIELLRVRDPQQMGSRAAERLAELVARKPEAVLALPSGRTPLPLYEELGRRHPDGRVDLSEVTVFCLDEYRGLPHQSEESYVAFLQRNLLSKVKVGCLFAFDGQAPDTTLECQMYEAALADASGLDLAVLGIGRNGHLALNEPGSPFDSRTRLVSLTEETRADQAWLFGDPSRVPREGLTLGLGTLLNARAILLLASGRAKADILSVALAGPVTEAVPASALQRHPQVTVIADETATSLL